MNQPAAELFYCRKCKHEAVSETAVCSFCGGPADRISLIKSMGTIAIVLMSFVLIVGLGLIGIIALIAAFGPFKQGSFTAEDYVSFVLISLIGLVLCFIGTAGGLAGWRQKRMGRYQPWLIFVIIFGVGGIAFLSALLGLFK